MLLLPSVLQISSFIYNNKAKFVVNEWRISGALKAGATPKASSGFTFHHPPSDRETQLYDGRAVSCQRISWEAGKPKCSMTWCGGHQHEPHIR